MKSQTKTQLKDGVQFEGAKFSPTIVLNFVLYIYIYIYIATGVGLNTILARFTFGFLQQIGETQLKMP
jgi:hypothetical protein